MAAFETQDWTKAKSDSPSKPQPITYAKEYNKWSIIYNVDVAESLAKSHDVEHILMVVAFGAVSIIVAETSIVGADGADNKGQNGHIDDGLHDRGNENVGGIQLFFNDVRCMQQFVE